MSKPVDPAAPRSFLPPAWRRFCILSLIIASLAGLYSLAGFFLAPWLITRYAPQYAADMAKVQLSFDRLRINPWLLTCETEGFNLRLAEDAPLFSARRIFVDFEVKSLFRQAWTFADLAIENPVVDLVIDTDGRLNLTELLDRLPKSEEAPEAEKKSPALRLAHFLLSGGTVRLTDHSKPGPAGVTIMPVALELNNISTLPDQRGTYAVSASLPKGGELDWQGELSLQPISATGSIAIKGLKPAAFWSLIRDRLNMEEPTGTAQLTASYRLAYHNGAPAFEVHSIDFALRDLSLHEKGASQPLLKFESLTATNGKVDFSGHRMVFPAIRLTGAEAEALVNPAGVGNWQRLIVDKPDPDPEEPPLWQIAVESLEAGNLRLRFRDASQANPISVEAALSMALTGNTIDLGQKVASIKRFALTGGGISLIREKGGSANAANSGEDRTASEEKTLPAETDASSDPPWKLALDHATVSGFHVGFVDRESTPPFAYDLTDLQAGVKDVTSPVEKPVAFEVRTEIKQGGSAGLSGTVSLAGKRIEARITLAQLNLKPLDFLVAEHAALVLVSADFSTDARLRYLSDGEKPSLSLTGEAKIGNVLLNEEKSGDRLIAWKELAARGLDFSLNPDHLNIKEIRLREPGAKIIIFKDKSFNLANVRKEESVAREEGPEKPPFPVTIERVRLENGVVDFSDFSLVLPFAARVEQFKGAATSISTAPNSLTSLKFEGKVGEFGQAKAEGSLIPANPKKFTDIRVVFRNVAMPPLSPYTATFAGRTIEAGKLNLNLGYNIKESELLGENSVVLENFSLGERVESPTATNLPLDLAIALLTDRNGKIDIAMPVRGNVDHPEFSYGHLVWQAVLNLLSKIVTSPFRALASLFGGSDVDMSTILFEPGRADLAPPEQEKLKQLAGALDKRKQLQLTVHGGFEPGLDGAALNSANIRRALAEKLGVKLDPGEDPGPVAFDNAKTQRALESIAGDKLTVFQTGYEKRTGQKAKRVNPAMALLGKAGDDHEFYRGLFDYLVKTAPIPQAELQTLAELRGKAIAEEITKRGGTEASRIIVGEVVQTEEKDKAVPAKLELGLP